MVERGKQRGDAPLLLLLLRMDLWAELLWPLSWFRVRPALLLVIRDSLSTLSRSGGAWRVDEASSWRFCRRIG